MAAQLVRDNSEGGSAREQRWNNHVFTHQHDLVWLSNHAQAYGRNPDSRDSIVIRDTFEYRKPKAASELVVAYKGERELIDFYAILWDATHELAANYNLDVAKCPARGIDVVDCLGPGYARLEHDTTVDFDSGNIRVSINKKSRRLVLIRRKIAVHGRESFISNQCLVKLSFLESVNLLKMLCLRFDFLWPIFTESLEMDYAEDNFF